MEVTSKRSGKRRAHTTANQSHGCRTQAASIFFTTESLPWLRADKTTRRSSTCLASQQNRMQPLTRYGLMAEKHWREHRPKMVRELEAKGLLHEMLLEAQEKTEDEMDALRRQLMKQGLTAQQAHDQAWEMVREKYILLPAESE